MRKLIFLLPLLVQAQTASFDSDTIAGLGARSLGPGIISGRVAAVTAVRENGRLRFCWHCSRWCLEIGQ